MHSSGGWWSKEERGRGNSSGPLVDHKSGVNQKRVKLKLGISRSLSFLAIMGYAVWHAVCKCEREGQINNNQNRRYHLSSRETGICHLQLAPHTTHRDREIQSTLCSVQRQLCDTEYPPYHNHPSPIDLIYKSQCQNLARKFIFMVEHLNLFVPAHTHTIRSRLACK